MATTMSGFRPAGFESDEDDYSDEDGFMFGGGGFDKHKPVKTNLSVMPSTETSGVTTVSRGGFGKPVTSNGDGKYARTSPWSNKKSSCKRTQAEKTSQCNTVKAKPKMGGHENGLEQGVKQKIIPLEDFRSTILRGNIEGMKKYIDDGVPVDMPLSSGWTALMYAGNVANPEAMKILLEKGANPNFHANRFTVLMATASSRKTDKEEDLVRCTELLIEKGADKDAFDRYHMSALMYAAREGKARLVQKFIEYKVNLDKQDNRGNTALSLAAMKGHLRVVQLLVTGGADVNKQCSDGSTPADVAYNAGHEQVCNFLGKFGGNLALQKQLIQSVPGDEMLSGISTEASLTGKENQNSEPTCMKYGDLELFLSGLELSQLIPVFQEQQVNFSAFLRFTDHDLLKLGVTQIGARKKLLEAIKDTHKKEWETSSLVSVQYNKQISCPETIAMMANINKHARYMGSTVGFIADQIREHPNILRTAQEGATVDDLCSGLETSLANVKILYGELSHLRIHVGQMAKKENFTPADLIIPRKRRRHPFWRRALLVASVFSAMGFFVWKADDIAHGCGTLFSKAVKSFKM